MAYTNSPLVSYTKISPNRNSPRNHAIDTISIHCVVGQLSVETMGNIFAPAEKEASANYGVGVDGRIGLYVEEKDRSWCTSSRENDNRAITIEVACDLKHPYAVNDKAYAALIDLLVDICKRNGIKKLVWSTDKNARMNHLNGCNMTVHRDYANKACPGEWLYSRHGQIAAEVNKRLEAAEKPTKYTAIEMPSLTLGMQCPEVKTLRRLLRQLEYVGADGKLLTIKDIYDEETKAAVIRYQRNRGAKNPTGDVMEWTWNKLLRGI